MQRRSEPNLSLPDAVVSGLLERVRENPLHWKHAVAEPRLGIPLWQRQWLTNPQTSVIFELMSPAHRRSFLEIGRGFGTISARLSEAYEHGFCLPLHEEWSELASHRFSAERIGNVAILRGNSIQIPLESDSIDFIALNCALEIAPTLAQSGGSYAAQLEMLSEARRCLHKNGRIVLSARNSWFTSPSDNGSTHAGVFDQVFLRSHNGYVGLLRRAGFREVRSFVVTPNLYTPIDVFSLDRAGTDWLFSRRHSNSSPRRLLKLLSDWLRLPYLGAYFEAGFYIVAHKQSREL